MTEGVESGGITLDGCAVLPTEKQEGAAGGVRPATSRRVYRPPELVRMRKTVGVACAGEIREGGRWSSGVRRRGRGPARGERERASGPPPEECVRRRVRSWLLGGSANGNDEKCGNIVRSTSCFRVSAQSPRARARRSASPSAVRRCSTTTRLVRRAQVRHGTPRRAAWGRGWPLRTHGCIRIIQAKRSISGVCCTAS